MVERPMLQLNFSYWCKASRCCSVACEHARKMFSSGQMRHWLPGLYLHGTLENAHHGLEGGSVPIHGGDQVTDMGMSLYVTVAMSLYRMVIMSPYMEVAVSPQMVVAMSPCISLYDGDNASTWEFLYVWWWQCPHIWGWQCFHTWGWCVPLHRGDHVPIHRGGSITTHSDSNVTIRGGGCVPHVAMSLYMRVGHIQLSGLYAPSLTASREDGSWAMRSEGEGVTLIFLQVFLWNSVAVYGVWWSFH